MGYLRDASVGRLALLHDTFHLAFESRLGTSRGVEITTRSDTGRTLKRGDEEEEE